MENTEKKFLNNYIRIHPHTLPHTHTPTPTHTHTHTHIHTHTHTHTYKSITGRYFKHQPFLERIRALGTFHILRKSSVITAKTPLPKHDIT